MSSHSKHRMSLLMLPIVVAAGLAIALKAIEWRQSIRVAELSGRVTQGDAREAIVAVQELAAIANPPVRALVSAAASDQREAALVAQASIDRLLRRWQRSIDSQNRAKAVCDQLSELAQSLDETKPKFVKADHAWLVSTVRKILRIANELPTTEVPLIALHCDAVLVAIGTGDFHEEPEALPGAVMIDDSIASTPMQASVSEAKDLPVGMQQLASPVADDKTLQESAPAPYAPPLSAEPLAKTEDATANRLMDSTTSNELRVDADKSDSGGAKDKLSPRTAIAPQIGGTSPVFRILPTVPSNGSFNGDHSSRLQHDSRISAESGVGTANNPLGDMATRDLLKSWLESEGGEGQMLARELSRRGFGKLSKSLVKQYFSEDPQDRIRLVNQAQAQRGGGAEAWLLLLASDSDADVRLFAVTFMATSNNAALMEKAWQIAIRDRDPRIADLAGRLRERRDGRIRR